jgi:hypothetical protein
MDNTYYTGKPCKHGHVARRYKSSGACLECHKIHGNKRRKVRYAEDQEYRSLIVARVVKYQRGRFLSDPGYREWRREYDKEWKLEKRKDPEYLAKAKRWAKLWRDNNPERRHIRIARVRKATPYWVDIDEMIRVYANRPEGHHVDHIIPIIGKYDGVHVVCGLNVPWNLQYLSASENSSKGCKYVS